MINEFFSGISAYTKAYALIKKLRLQRYLIAPVVISLLTGVVIFWLAYYLAEDLGNYLVQFWNYSWAAETLSKNSHWIGAICIIWIGIVTYKHLVLALSAPFMTPVSEKIEQHLAFKKNIEKPKTPSFSTSILRALWLNGRNLLLELLLVLPLLVFSFIPILGIASSAIIFLVQAYYVGFGNMDYTLERHLSAKKSIAFIAKNKANACGNGVVFMVLLCIPVIGACLALPLAAVAATIETLRLLERHDKIQLKTIVYSK